MVLAAMKRSPSSWQYASEALKGDADFFSQAIKCNSSLVFVRRMLCDFAWNSIRANHRIGLSAVGIDGMLLEHLSNALQEDQEVVCAAVRQNVQALQFASEALQDDMVR